MLNTKSGGFHEIVYELPLLVCREANVSGPPTTYGCGLVAVGEAIAQGNAQHQQRQFQDSFRSRNNHISCWQ
jgi:hypothetical protein